MASLFQQPAASAAAAAAAASRDSAAGAKSVGLPTDYMVKDMQVSGKRAKNRAWPRWAVNPALAVMLCANAFEVTLFYNLPGAGCAAALRHVPRVLQCEPGDHLQGIPPRWLPPLYLTLLSTEKQVPVMLRGCSHNCMDKNL